MERTLDAVLPLTQRDVARAELLFETLLENLRPLRTVWVVAPDEDVPIVSRRVPSVAVVLGESTVVPELRWFRVLASLRSRLHIVGPPFNGWFVQQLVKLAIAARVETPFYVTLDADVLCMRPTTYDDLVVDGRALTQTSPPNHPEWNDDAERVLALPRSGVQWAVTPSVLAREGVRALARHLERCDRATFGPRGWRAYLLRALPWTEYALYHTFLEATGLHARFHTVAGEDALYDNAVWMESQFDEWEPDAGSAPFTVVQSATRIDPVRVRAKLRRLARVRE